MNITFNGFKIDIIQDKVTIYDLKGDLSEGEAVVILKYLKAEGFLFHDQVLLEIVPEDKEDD